MSVNTFPIILGILESPSPILRKIAMVSLELSEIVALKAVPRIGAEHGVETMVASTPMKNVPIRPDLLLKSLHTPVALNPISNKPLMLSPKTSMMMAVVITMSGFCIWNPQPTASPALRRLINVSASKANEMIMPRV